MDSKKIIKHLIQAGWVLRNVKGSHPVFTHPNQPGHISVPHPKKDLGKGLVQKLLKQADIIRLKCIMKFVLAIEPGDQDHAFGVVAPDLPGCFSAGDTLDEAVDNAHEAIDLWCQTVIEDGGDIPTPAPLAAHQQNPDYQSWIWALVDVPVERYFGPAEKINITLPRRVLARVDDYVKTHGESRSGFLSRAALQAMR